MRNEALTLRPPGPFVFCGTASEGFFARVRFRWAGDGNDDGDKGDHGGEDGEGEGEGQGRWFEVEHWVEVRSMFIVCIYASVQLHKLFLVHRSAFTVRFPAWGG